VVADLDTQQHVIKLGLTTHAPHPAIVLEVSVVHGLLGAHALEAHELELELVLQEMFVQHLKLKHAVHGIVQQVLTLTALVAHNQLKPLTLVVADLDTQQPAAHLDIQYVEQLAIAMQHKQLDVQPGLLGVLALLHLNQEQELVLLETHA
jgi:hypothetical protein